MGLVCHPAVRCRQRFVVPVSGIGIMQWFVTGVQLQADFQGAFRC
jgi:hypothetical protein